MPNTDPEPVAGARLTPLSGLTPGAKSIGLAPEAVRQMAVALADENQPTNFRAQHRTQLKIAERREVELEAELKFTRTSIRALQDLLGIERPKRPLKDDATMHADGGEKAGSEAPNADSQGKAAGHAPANPDARSAMKSR